MKKRVLVLDDIEFNRITIKTYLSIAGYIVDVAENGIHGLKYLSGNKYDLIFSDIEMPNMNGFEFLKRIKTNSEHKHIPVIMLSSLNDNETKKKAKELGAVCHISKPYNSEKMKNALKMAGF